ncbi:MAG: response regulator, partial [Magnetococcales bacterium]|nr:response regulator [Magnetococcales bacterium]
RIVNDILDFSKIEAKKLDLEVNDFLIRDIFDNLSDLFRGETDRKGIELIMGMSTECQFALSGDSLRLEQILMNLISNAIKFTDEGEIVISVTAVEAKRDFVELEFTVNDTGIGMTKEQMSNLFSPFVQVDGSAARKITGTGLGLSICKHLTELMGGKIAVESIPNRGTTFSFTTCLARRVQDENGDEMLPPDEMMYKRALMVDDNPAVRKVLVEMLNLFTFKATAVASGREAQKAIREGIAAGRPYKLALIDWLMPEMDGVETVRRIAKSSYREVEDLKKIMLTNFTSQDEIIQRVGCTPVDAYIAKPVNCSLLFDTIMEVFGVEVNKTYRHERDIINTAVISNRIGGAKILLVEDNIINQQVAKEILENAGLRVEIANNGLEAVVKATKNHFDAVLMDIQMPEMDGYQATRLIRKNSRCKKLPIIAMTAHALSGDRDNSLAAGMNDHITKPVDKKQLFSVLTNWISQKELTAKPLQQVSSNCNVKIATLPKDLPGIDVAGAMVRLNGNQKLFRTLLLEFKNSYANSTQKISSALKGKRKDDLKSARLLVHSIKGMAGNLSANSLFIAAQELERGIKNRKMETLPKLMDEFSTQMKLLLNTIATIQVEEQAKSESVSDSIVEYIKEQPIIHELTTMIEDNENKSSMQLCPETV